MQEARAVYSGPGQSQAVRAARIPHILEERGTATMIHEIETYGNEDDAVVHAIHERADQVRAAVTERENGRGLRTRVRAEKIEHAAIQKVLDRPGGAGVLRDMLVVKVADALGEGDGLFVEDIEHDMLDQVRGNAALEPETVRRLVALTGSWLTYTIEMAHLVLDHEFEEAAQHD